MHKLETATALFAKTVDLIVGQRGMTAVDMADDIGVRLEHDVLVDETGAGDRRAAGMDRAVDPIFASPGDHLARGRSILDAAEPDFAEIADAGAGQLGEVLFLHPRFDDRRAGVNLDAARAERRETTLRIYGHGLEADDVARPAGRMYLAGRHHRRDAAVQARIDPAELALTRRPISSHRMDVAVDQTGSERNAIGVDRRCRSR